MPKKAALAHQSDFDEIHKMIREAKVETYHKINQILIKLYCSIGQYVSQKIESSVWGENVVPRLAKYLESKEPGAKGFSARNIWRMKKFYETYISEPKLSALLTEITWTNHLHILSKTKTIEEKEFYLQLATKHRYSERDFARMIDSGTI